MWFVSFIIMLTSAGAAAHSDVKTHDIKDKPEVQAAPIEGKLALDNAVRALGYQLEDVEILQVEYTEGIEAPEASLALRRHQQWSARFGQSKLQVRHKRIADSAILDKQTVTRRRSKKEKEICTTGAAQDTRDVQLTTFGHFKPKAIEADKEGTSQHHLYYLSNDKSRTAVAQLAPGESITVVEVFGKPTKQPKRRIKVRRGKETMSITETQNQRQICVSSSQQ
jgi:methionine-rich copper-binding protein CopC